MIPQDKIVAVARGLREAFGTESLDDVRRITRGLSADLIFRIVVKGSPFLLRIMTQIDERNDPTRIFACTKTAADAGLAPDVRYTNLEDGIAIIDYVEAVPFSQAEARVRMPAAMSRLHALPPFPKTLNYVTMHKFFVWRLREANLLPASEIDKGFARYTRIVAVYPRVDADMVSSHNDLKPENVLFDGQRVWLVDWQAAFLNDRYFDLAVVANFIVTSDAEAKDYLHAYLGQPPNDYQLARLYLMRQVTHMLYTAAFLLLGTGIPSSGQQEGLPTFREFHERIWEGKIDLAEKELRTVYGLVHWNELLRNTRTPRFAEALEIVSERHPSVNDEPRLLPVAP